MSTCCEHCRLKDAAAPPDDFMVDWPEEELLPRWLTAGEDTWVTKEGQVISITELEDSHLYNINRMLERIETSMGEMDEEGHPTDPGPPVELFDRKFSAIKAEIARRDLLTKASTWEEGYPHEVD